MEVILNGRTLDEELEGATLQQLLNDLATRYLGGDRALREVKINGEPFQEATMGSAQDIASQTIESLEVDTIEARELALHCLSTVGPTLDMVKLATGKVAELFRVADEREANEQYLRLLESLQLLLQMLQQCREVLSLDFGAAKAQGTSAEERLERLAVLVKDMLTAQEDQDWVLLADILEYDLGPELEAWQELIKVLHQQGSS